MTTALSQPDHSSGIIRADRSMAANTLSDQLIVYLVVPVGLALFIASLQPGRSAAWPSHLNIPYWICHVQIGWLIKDVSTRLLGLALRPLRIPFPALLVLAALLSTPLVYLGLRGFLEAFQAAFIDPSLALPLPKPSLKIAVDDYLMGSVIWLTANYLFVRHMGISRFGFCYTPPSGPEAVVQASTPAVLGSAAERPEFWQLLDRPIGMLLALNSEQHYLNVIGDEGDTIIRYRISDAAAELAPLMDGLRVHRSWWVASAAIDRIKRQGRDMTLVLHNGLSVPVSRKYQPDVRALETHRAGQD